MTISTFGGNPMSAAAANATLQVIEDDKLADNSQDMGDLLRAGLVDLMKQFPQMVGDVRGRGLMQAMELVVDEKGGDRTPNPLAVNRLFEATRKRGLLIGKGGYWGNTLRISPPLTVGKSEVEEALKILREGLAEIQD
jgi:4-aminobutyrate aminotransferase-like enzyme